MSTNNPKNIELINALRGYEYDSEKVTEDIKNIKANFYGKSTMPSQKKPVKKKQKYQLTPLGKKVVGLSLAVAITPCIITAVKHMPYFERQQALSDAQEYFADEMMPAAFSSSNYTVIHGKEGETYLANFGYKEFDELRSQLMAQGLSKESAEYGIFSYFNFSDEIFQVVGYKNGIAYAKANGYQLSKEWDRYLVLDQELGVYCNMHENKFANETIQIKDSQENENAR